MLTEIHLLLLATAIDEEDKTTLSLDSESVETDEMEECISVCTKWTMATPLHFPPLKI
jgi:hypothetical protein